MTQWFKNTEPMNQQIYEWKERLEWSELNEWNEITQWNKLMKWNDMKWNEMKEMKGMNEIILYYIII